MSSAPSDPLNETLLRRVALEDITSVPDDLDDATRFVVSAVRSVARRNVATGLTTFVRSEAPGPDGKVMGFARVAHLQDGHGDLQDKIVLASPEVNNGTSGSAPSGDPSEVMNTIESFKWDTRATVIWDYASRIASFYPAGIADDQNVVRFHVPLSSSDLTQDEVCAVLDLSYNDNMKNPSAHTVKLWVKNVLVKDVEDQIERHLKGQLSIVFAGHNGGVKILAQTNTGAGRCDLVFLQKKNSGPPLMVGVLELKALRGPLASDVEVTKEGLSQGFHYRREIELPFATLALYDVSTNPTSDATNLLNGQNPEHLAVVKVRRFPMYSSPGAWRAAGGYVAP